MPVTYDDTFFDDLGATLPAHSVKFLNRAASWSSRNSRSGFVTATAAAELSDDVDRDTGPLLSAGVMRRGKKGGLQIVEGMGITIENAKDVARQAERDQAKASQTREQGRIRAKRKRDRDRAARLAAMAENVTRDVTQESREKVPNVTRYESAEPKKLQVSPRNVTRYAAGSSRVTPKTETDRSDLSVSGGQSKSTRAREAEPEPYTPAFRARVAADLALRGPWPVDDITADAVTAEVLGKSKKPVTHPVLFVSTAIVNEPNPQARWNLTDPVPAASPKRRDHCGDRECSPRTRRREDPATGADLGPCPKCSGADPAWVEARLA